MLGWILVADVVVGWVGRMVADVLIEIYGKIMLVILLDSIFLCSSPPPPSPSHTMNDTQEQTASAIFGSLGSKM